VSKHAIIFQKENQSDVAIFGFKLSALKSKILTDNPASILQKHQKDVSNFINKLYDSERNITFSLRYIIDPNPEFYSLGNIDIVLLIKITINSDDLVLVDQLDSVIKPLLGSSFSNYVWEDIIEEEKLLNWINPIDWDRAHFAEIRRREELYQIDTILPRRPIGFGNQNELETEKPENAYIYYVHPYVTPLNGFQNTLRTIFQGTSKIVLTTLLKPTVLADRERDFLYTQISKCETPGLDTKLAMRVQNKQAYLLSRGLLRQYLSLEDAPFYMTFTVASEHLLDRFLLEMIGLGISEPIGQNVPPATISDDYFFQSGGYDVIIPRTREEIDVLKHNMRSLSQNIWGDHNIEEEQKRLRFLFDGSEAASAFFLPMNVEEDLPGINTFYFMEKPIPKEMMAIPDPNKKILLGQNHYYGFEQDVVISEDTRKQHTYIIGQTGTGKTTLMKSMILSDIKAGNGLAVIDPHGELYDDLLELIPEERKNDVVLFNPSDTDFPIGFNLLQVKHDDEREAVVKEMRAILKRYIFEYFNISQGEYAGPVFFQHLQNNMLLVTSDIENPGTIIELYNIFLKDDYWRRWLPLKWKNHILEQWVENYLPVVRYTAKTSDGGISGDYFSSKLADFANDPRLSLIFGQPYSTIDLKDIVENKKLLFVNLSKGLLGEASSSLLGMILMAKFNTYFMERRKFLADGKQLPTFYLYVDEFQNLATENFSILLSESRKFGLGLILANQFISQIKDYKIREAIFGNIGTIISFRLGIEDANVIESQFLPHYNHQDLCNLPNYNAIIRTNIEGKRSTPCNFQTIIPESASSYCDKCEILYLSRQKYSLPKELAEFIVKHSLSDYRFKKTRYYYEKDGTPSNELIINSNIISTIVNVSNNEKEYFDTLKFLQLVIQAQIIYYLLYEKQTNAQIVSNILSSIEPIKPEVFFEDFSKVIDLIAIEQDQERKEIIGIYNYYISNYLLHKIQVVIGFFHNSDNESWINDVLTCYKYDKWASGNSILTLHSSEIEMLIKNNDNDIFDL